ncbi:MAG: hypothetical protein ACYS8Z_14730 [Planctomycetota bacterium]
MACDVPVASSGYDNAGRRISKTVYGSPDSTAKDCYDGDQVIAEYDGSAILLRRFIYGGSTIKPFCMIDVADSNAIYYSVTKKVKEEEKCADTPNFQRDVYGQQK